MAAEGMCPARRRSLKAALLAALAGATPLARVALAQPAAPGVHGGPVVPPAMVPDFALTLADGTTLGLAELLRGKATALQLIYTGCTTTCPMQGAIFQRVQREPAITNTAGVQLLSLSIDPLDDTPASLRLWLARFEAREGWTAARPEPADLSRLLAFFGDRAGGIDAHSTEVSIIDRNGALVWRTNELPAPQSVASLLWRLARSQAGAPNRTQ